MKNMFLFLLIMSATTHLLAQDGDIDTDTVSKLHNANHYPVSGYFVFGCGLAMPVGNFYEKTQLYRNGYAKFGTMPLFVEFAAPIARSHFGVVLNMNYCRNNLDLSSGNINYSSDQKRYHTVLFLGGLFITVPEKYFSFDIKLTTGLAVVSVPDMQFTYSPGSHMLVTQKNTTTADVGFVYGLGANFRFPLGKHGCIQVSSGFTHANPNYHTTINYQTTWQMTNSSYNMQTTIATLSVGYGVRF